MAPDMFAEALAEGRLVFEKPGGERIQFRRAFRQVLKGGQVPLVVLNACQSGAWESRWMRRWRQRLLREGTASSWPLGYSVYAVAAAEFMAALYEALLREDRRRRGSHRRRLRQANLRPRPQG